MFANIFAVLIQCILTLTLKRNNNNNKMQFIMRICKTKEVKCHDCHDHHQGMSVVATIRLIIITIDQLSADQEDPAGYSADF